MRGGWLALAAVGTAAPACFIDFSVADGTIITCATTADCPESLVCVGGMCADPEVGVAPAIEVNKTRLQTTEGGMTDNFAVSLTTTPAAEVIVDLSVEPAGEVTLTPSQLRFLDSAAQTVTVTGVIDCVADADTPYTVRVLPASSTDADYDGLDATDLSGINADSASGVLAAAVAGSSVTTEVGGTVTIAIQTPCEPTAAVTVIASSSDPAEGTVTAPPGGAVIVTPANWLAPPTILVTGQDDDIDDDDRNYDITFDVVSADVRFDGIVVGSVTLTNTDDDMAGFSVPAPMDNTTSENGDQVTLMLSLSSEPLDDVTVNLTTSDATEAFVESPSPAFYIFTPGNWDTPRTVRVEGINDPVDDDSVGFTLNLSAASTDQKYQGLSGSGPPLSNTDNDQADIVTGTQAMRTDETGLADSFDVTLQTEPLTDVTVPISGDSTEGMLSPMSLTFTPMNWDQAQTVTITGVDDMTLDGISFYNVVLGPATSADGKYDQLAGPSVPVINHERGYRYMFVTSTTFTGNLGSTGGADSNCENAGNKPGGADQFKAVLQGVGRSATNNWVLDPNVEYRRDDDSTVIFTTDSTGLFTFGNFDNPVSSTPVEVWTGLGATWSPFANCNGWTVDSGSIGFYGQANDTDEGAINAGSTMDCGEMRALWCAEQ